MRNRSHRSQSFSVADLKRAVCAARLVHLDVERIDIDQNGNLSLKTYPRGNPSDVKNGLVAQPNELMDS
jgi:hypothetical protein